jgi:hypothetical protein
MDSPEGGRSQWTERIIGVRGYAENADGSWTELGRTTLERK